MKSQRQLSSTKNPIQSDAEAASDGSLHNYVSIHHDARHIQIWALLQ